jgi:S1-C subfamily serine protease
MRWPALIFALALAGGCGGAIVEEVPAETPQQIAPTRIADSQAAEGIAAAAPVQIARDSVQRQAKQMTVRIRNLGCEGLGTGSGFALSESVLGTNRHVLAGADQLEVSTWDGRTLNITAAEVQVFGDLAFVEVDGTLPVVAELSHSIAPGSPVTAVGYPLGGPLTLSEGVVIDRVAGDVYGLPGDVLQVTATVEPGNSGGPLLDAQGRVVAVVFGVDTENGYGLAIPVDEAQELLEAGGVTSVPPCGFE